MLEDEASWAAEPVRLCMWAGGSDTRNGEETGSPALITADQPLLWQVPAPLHLFILVWCQPRGEKIL